MTHLIRSLAVACLAALFCLTAVAGPASVPKRQVRQQKRIGHGVRNGQLTRPEVRGLERNAARIHSQLICRQ